MLFKCEWTYLILHMERLICSVVVRWIFAFCLDVWIYLLDCLGNISLIVSLEGGTLVLFVFVSFPYVLL